MQASVEEKLDPDCDCHPEMDIINDSQLKLGENLQDDDVKSDEEKLDVLACDDCEQGEQEEDDFSFYCGDLNTSPIAAEDAFINGQIKPVYPLFGRDLAFSGDRGSNSLHEKLCVQPYVKKIFVETNHNGQEMTSSRPGDDEIVGPYCEWSSRKAVEASPGQVCKKSNSTGFSKIWRFKELVGRCNSEGRDAFVFLNNGADSPTPPTSSRATAKENIENTESATVKIKKEPKKGGKSSKTASLSAHEAYLRSKSKEEERRRSYLPYRPELLGFFTNVNGGLTKNVHPF